MLSLFMAIIFILAVTPLGFIPLGYIRATIIHIPVIMGAILLGPYLGIWLGFFFGLISLFINTFNPTVTSFVFTPFYSIGDYSGNFNSLIICFLPRILIGLTAGLTFIILNKFVRNKLKYFIIGALGSLVNTILVLYGIYLFFGHEYAMIKGIEYSELVSVLAIIILTNGVIEAIISCIICGFGCPILIKLYRKNDDIK